MSFPLYDSICEKINDDINTPLDHDKKIAFCDFVKKSEQNIHELLYMLMKTHQIKYDATSSTSMPFDGKEQKCGLKFDIDNLPIKLQQILFSFSQIESKK
jgi:hypothetical protein